MENLLNCEDVLLQWKKNKHREVIVKDMQKQLPLPRLQPQPTEQYRAKQLFLNNFGVYFASKSKMHCYTWTEYDGRKQSDEFCSILWMIFDHIANSNMHFQSWSDNCVSQNQCWMIIFFHAWLVLGNYCKTATLYFFLKGHTFTIPDLFFGNIEQKAKKISIEIPRHYHEIMESLGCEVIPVPQSNFFDWSFLNTIFFKGR